jgi:hypothetical protein
MLFLFMSILSFGTIYHRFEGCKHMKTMIIIASMAIALSGGALAQTPYIVSPDGQYLGNLSTNPYDPNSVSNPYGQYGSPYSPDSINNPYGQYGSPYSPNSVNNPYATQPPLIIVPNSSYRR